MCLEKMNALISRGCFRKYFFHGQLTVERGFGVHKVLGRRSEIEAQIQKLTDEIIENQAASVNLHKEEAINLLLRLVMDIQPRLHQNYRIGAAV
ncbi:uncharacterized protein DEA37_0014707 [Paragonimus westermani]|uniref:Uncharacterized protein n=1 Tax=Paragonimus westermani TaxID=34504 RepID=A0A5J4NAI6_9TREM|nr:uncharacterized protein DEA37_0014707 [Paragonimus westermani]